VGAASGAVTVNQNNTVTINGVTDAAGVKVAVEEALQNQSRQAAHSLGRP
jgi:hypothetical protein